MGVKRVNFFIFATFRSIRKMYLVVTGVIFRKIVLKKAIELEIRPFSLKRPYLMIYLRPDIESADNSGIEALGLVLSRGSSSNSG